MELNFYKVKSGTAFIDTYEGKIDNVIIINKGYEDTKNMEWHDDFIDVDIFQPNDISYNMEPYRESRKLTENAWLMIGVSDWESQEIEIADAEHCMIKALFDTFTR